MNFRIIAGKISDHLEKEMGRVPYDYEIAKALQMTQASYATAKYRKNIPFENILLFCFNHRVSGNVLFFGEFSGQEVRVPSRVKASPCA